VVGQTKLLKWSVRASRPCSLLAFVILGRVYLEDYGGCLPTISFRIRFIGHWEGWAFVGRHRAGGWTISLGSSR